MPDRAPTEDDCWRHGKVGEVHAAISLRPESDTSRDRLRQLVLEIELVVEVAIDLAF
jgi:hypothetical protein